MYMMVVSPRLNGSFNVIIKERDGDGGGNRIKIENKKAHGNHLAACILH